MGYRLINGLTDCGARGGMKRNGVHVHFAFFVFHQGCLQGKLALTKGATERRVAMMCYKAELLSQRSAIMSIPTHTRCGLTDENGQSVFFCTPPSRSSKLFVVCSVEHEDCSCAQTAASWSRKVFDKGKEACQHAEIVSDEVPTCHRPSICIKSDSLQQRPQLLDGSETGNAYPGSSTFCRTSRRWCSESPCSLGVLPKKTTSETSLVERPQLTAEMGNQFILFGLFVSGNSPSSRSASAHLSPLQACLCVTPKDGGCRGPCHSRVICDTGIKAHKNSNQSVLHRLTDSSQSICIDNPAHPIAREKEC